MKIKILHKEKQFQITMPFIAGVARFRECRAMIARQAVTPHSTVGKYGTLVLSGTEIISFSLPLGFGTIAQEH